ncbi:MAG: hypothetical protein Fur0018_00720 [Anaerolineales bacterium]
MFSKRLLPFLGILPLILAACGGAPAPQATPTPLNVAASATPASEVSPTSVVTPTPQPLPGVWLVLPQGDFPADTGLPSYVQRLAESQGWQVTILETLPDAIAPEVRAVIAPLADDLSALAQANPNTWFIGGGAASTSRPANLSLLDASTASLKAQAFLAGYVAALTTDDWRIATIAPDEDTLNAFRNGAVYFCGLCRPAYPPYYPYPLTVQLAPGASADQWYSALSNLQTQGVEVVYIAPALWTQQDVPLSTLADTSLLLISDHALEGALEAHWLAGIAPDFQSALLAAWDGFLRDGTGEIYPVGLRVQSGAVNWISPGRQRLAEDLAAGLQSGAVLP